MSLVFAVGEMVVCGTSVDDDDDNDDDDVRKADEQCVYF